MKSFYPIMDRACLICLLVRVTNWPHHLTEYYPVLKNDSNTIIGRWIKKLRVAAHKVSISRDLYFAIER